MFLSNCGVIARKSRGSLIINKFFLNEDKFKAELHLRQPGFTCSACGPFTKHRKRIRKFRETGNLKHLYRNELNKACFTYDVAYSDSKDLAKRTISDKFLNDRAYEIARSPKYSIIFLIRKQNQE